MADGKSAPSRQDPYHETRTEIRYAETDQMGYAHHAAAATWFELGRVVWLRERGLPYGKLEAEGVLLPVIRLEIQYAAPGRFEDLIVIQTRLLKAGHSRLIFENRVLREGVECGAPELLVEGRVHLACVDSTGRVRRLPKSVRQVLRRPAEG